jgi:hypothetical protein
MKKILLAICILCSLDFLGQKIVEDKIDEFTKQKIKRTSWDPFSRIKGINDSFTRIEKIDSTYWLEFKIMLSKVSAIDKGGELMLMTATDSIITLYNSEFQMSCSGCGAIGLIGSATEGFNLSFLLLEDELAYLEKNSIKKIRLYTTDGYIEREIHEKNKMNLSKQIMLIR